MAEDGSSIDTKPTRLLSEDSEKNRGSARRKRETQPTFIRK